ncbi:MAG: site-specific DNA-methyltransferase [Fibrobacter sp.]|nr:site-specific DNA-methyltransferase [Fibrobacter sp.]
MPEYEGKVKCIYIDPPYNTGNENWVYNDNVNSPKIRKWLGQVVGKEAEDLTRHDKWLCMMYPRLKLLHKLLREDGAIFISIDDNEQANLKLICDEIFGAGNFVANFIWQSTPGSNTGKDIKTVSEYILLYSKDRRFFVANTRNTCDDTKYNLEDNYVERRGRYTLNKLDRRMTGSHYSDALNYSIGTPDGNSLYPGNSSEKQEHWNWRWSKAKFEWGVKNDFIVFKQNGSQWSVYFKQYQSVDNNDSPIQRTLPYQNLLLDIDGASSARGTADLMSVFSAKKFDYPKPLNLIEYLLKIISGPNSIILDSFAGSGTTAHAVLNLNKQDGGNRKFILVEMEDYANNITAERVRRVINGYGEGKNAVEGTGGDFNYYELGPEMLLDGSLNEEQPLENIRNYIYYTETNSVIDSSEVSKNRNEFFLGNHDNAAYYLFYKKSEITTLDFEFLGTISQKAERYVIYADNCVLPKDFLFKNNIVFKKIPRDVRRF